MPVILAAVLRRKKEDEQACLEGGLKRHPYLPQQTSNPDSSCTGKACMVSDARSVEACPIQSIVPSQTAKAQSQMRLSNQTTPRITAPPVG